MGRFEPTVAVIDGRCSWCGDEPLYQSYHDNEWGKPISDDQRLFELIVLEGAQAGLSWLTVLRKRENYRIVFRNFNPVSVSQMTPDDVESLMNNHGIVRNRRKIESAISNAKAFLKIVDQFGSFEKYILSFFPNRQRIVNSIETYSQMPVSTPISDSISRDMKRRGFKFFGSTICYAFLQSAGFVNDHFASCKFKSSHD